MATAATSGSLARSRGNLTASIHRLWLVPFAHVGSRVRVAGPVLIRGRGTVTIGDDVVLDASTAPIELKASQGAVIEIGAGTRVGSGVQMEALERIEVGEGAVLDPHVTVLDSNMHHTSGDRRQPTPATRVTIGPGARIGARAILLPGAEVGAGTEVLADSMLSRRAPAGVVLAGVPARLVRRDA